MKRFLPVFLSLLFLLAACGAPAAPATSLPELPALPFVVTLTPGQQPHIVPQDTPEPPLPTEPPALPAISPSASPSLPPTLTAAPSQTVILPTPSETLLPQLELPTERANPPALVAWTGQPTYPGDSDPGLLFRMDYDPDLWAQTEGNFGDIVLGSRNIPYCTITPWTGRGLPVEWKVTHEFRTIGSASYDVNTVTYQDVVKFVSYVGGDRRILTGFQVSFNEQRDECLAQAEAIFGTLRSFAAQATVTPTDLPPSPRP